MLKFRVVCMVFFFFGGGGRVLAIVVHIGTGMDYIKIKSKLFAW